MTDRAVSANIGLVLLLALTIVGAGVVVGIGATALDDVQHRTSVDRAEHAMTLLDAKAAVVGLGEGSTQTVRLGRTTSGDYAAESDSGWLKITHTNYTANETETIYNASLGSVSYRTGGTTVAYQGGGVWRHQEDGGTSMVSPPEFHYRGTTLTLPVLRVRSTDAAAGETTATIRRDGQLTRIYPTEADGYTNGTGAPYDENATDGSIRQYDNPVRNGTVSVTVHSEYYEGWAAYFRSRTTGNVSVDDGNQTTTVALETTGQVGDFPLPEKNNGISVRGMSSGHSVTDFQTSIKKDGGTFNNLWASFYIEEGDRAYEVVVETPNLPGNYCDGDETTTSVNMIMDVYYYDGGTAEGVHRWSNNSISSDSGAVQLACDGGDTVIEVDFTDDTQTFTYGESSIDDDTAIDWEERNESATESAVPTEFNHTGANNDGEPITYEDDDTEEFRHLTRHYFAMFGTNFDLSVSHGPGNRGTTQIDQSASGGSLQYDRASGSTYITYLHITENNVTVELN